METRLEKQPSVLKKGQRITLWTLFVLGLIMIVILISVNVYINRSLPQTKGTIAVSALEKPVDIIRDNQGVPHLSASSDKDLFIAQGYVQAQDRLFQMDLARRQASGTLSEVAGKATVTQDKYFRTLGLRRAAEISYKSYSEDAKQVLEWYSQGVNAFIKQAEEERRLPVEFTLMGSSPKQWSPVDSLTIGKYMAFDLGGHWERQAFNYYLLQNLQQEKAEELFPVYPKHAPTILQQEPVDVTSSLEHAVIPHPHNGSNNWVVSGEKTASGYPLLANDPHLGLATPSIWYEMELSSPNYQVAGVIFTGIPGIILGHNEDIAWGVTNTGPDVQQLYLEKRHPEDPTLFLFEDTYEEAVVHEETIHIKGEEAIEYEVVETRHGPILSEFAKDSGKDTVLSLRWTALDASTELEAILEMNQAANWTEFEEGLKKFLVPTQNFVFASKDGTIAYKANGKIPIYESASDALVPLEGWKKENEWKGYIPFDELPTVINPEKGFIATANNKVIGDKYPYHISNNWAQPYRYIRIEEVLEENNKLTVQDMKNLQMDQQNLQAREFVPILLQHLQNQKLTTMERQGLEVLQSWNYEDDVTMAAPLLFHHWMNNIALHLFKDDVPDSMMEFFKGRGQLTDDIIRRASNGESLLMIEQQGGLDKLLIDSYQTTIDDLANTYGYDLTAWEWGEYHKVSFQHPLSNISYLKPFFNPQDPLPVGGSRVTVMAASYNQSTGIVNHGASWRFVADIGDLTSASHIVSPGQVGHFRSEWYHNQRKDWATGEYHDTHTSEVQGEKLTLLP